MPYRIEERDGKYCVVKETDGETIHCHETREQAEAQMRALYANAGEEAQKLVKAGNIEGLAQHLATRYGGDPGFFTRCMGVEELSGYSEETRAAICARAHEIVTGMWPGEHRGKATLYVPFSKIDHEQRMVWGVATDETRDAENDVVDYEATKRAVAEWAKWRNIREMHGPSAVGIAEEIVLDDATKSLRIGVKVVDDGAWAKVKAGVYKGFSIGGKVLRTMVQKAGEGNEWVRRIVDYTLTEISLVDRPANPRAVFTLVKRTHIGGAKKVFDKKKAAILRKRLAWLRTLNAAAQSLQVQRTALSKADGRRAAIAVETTDKAIAQTLTTLGALRRLAKIEEDEEVQQAVEAAQEAVETAQEALDQATVAADEARTELEADEESTAEEQSAIEAVEEAITETQEVLDEVSETLDEAQETLEESDTQVEPEQQSAGLTVEQVREIVLEMLQELGLLPSGEVTMAAQVSDLRKQLEAAASGEELKKLSGNLSKVVGDLAKVAAAVEVLEERLDLVHKMASGQGPVLREIAPWEVNGQSEAALKMMLADDSLDPRVREAVGQRLAEMQIKAAQRQAVVIGR